MSEVFNARLDLVPENPGVYLMKDAEGSIIYVGKAINLKSRLRSYFQASEKPSYRIALMVQKIKDFDFILCANELEALVLESGLIKRYQPFYNVLLKDDRDYPYLELNYDLIKPSFKKVFRRTASPYKEYFGPYLAAQLYPLLQSIYQIFPIKSCGKFSQANDKQSRACLQYHIGSCIGTCCGQVSVTEYHARLKKISAFLRGEYKKVLKDLEDQMHQEAEDLHFEKAAYLRDQIKGLEALRQKQRIVGTQNEYADLLAVAHAESMQMACLQKLEVREGRIVGGNTFFLEGVEKKEEAIEHFLLHYYNDFVFEQAQNEKDQKLKLYLEELNYSPLVLELLKEKVQIKWVKKEKDKEVWQIAKNTAEESLSRKLKSLEFFTPPEVKKNLALEYLKELLSVEHLKRIEAFDISNLGASHYSASMVVFKNGEVKKEDFRQFSLDLDEPNDYLAMSLALERRLKRLGERDFGATPQLLVVDGGLSHVHLAQKVIADLKIDLTVVGIVKNHKHKTRGLVLPNGETLELLTKTKKDEKEQALLYFLTRIQDEMHRRALLGQNKRWKKAQFRYKLEDIEGIGPAKRQIILDCFPSLKAVEEASLEELKEQLPFPPSLCERIYNYFRLETENDF